MQEAYQTVGRVPLHLNRGAKSGHSPYACAVARAYRSTPCSRDERTRLHSGQFRRVDHRVVPHGGDALGPTDDRAVVGRIPDADAAVSGRQGRDGRTAEAAAAATGMRIRRWITPKEYISVSAGFSGTLKYLSKPLRIARSGVRGT